MSFVAALSLAVPAPFAHAQNDPAAQMQELRLALDELRTQLAESRQESVLLRRELQALRDRLNAVGGSAELDALRQDLELLEKKLEEQEQVKVESGSKYHVRFSGVALVNVAGTRGSVDDIDVPRTAEPRSASSDDASISIGVRQSQLTFEVFGPIFSGAKTSGDVSIDFFGGFPASTDGLSAPLVRIRTAHVRLEWTHASLVVGQEAPFFSPKSPTSLASIAYPALSSSGNLWAWTPQIHVDHLVALSSASAVIVQWGVLDPLTAELPASEYSRTATAGERTGIPALAARVGWRRTVQTRITDAGVGFYHATQDWRFGRTVDAWAVTGDWDVPFGHWFAVSGELYRGRAIAGLGASATPSVLFSGPVVSASAVMPVDTTGGWAQVKFKPVNRVEFNGAYGIDKPSLPPTTPFLADGTIAVESAWRNASAFVNVIVQARSNLLFSIEYRRLWTTAFDASRRTASHLNVSAGIAF